MSERHEYRPATAASRSDHGIAGEHSPGDRTDRQPGQRIGQQPTKRAEKQAHKKPDGGLEKSSLQDRESGIAPGEQPAGVETNIGSRMPDRK